MNTKPHFASFAVALASVFPPDAAPTRPPAGLDTAAIDRAIGRSGQAMAGDVYRVAFPRTDLKVTVGGVAVLPGFALGSWAAFKAVGTSAVVHGDLVLLDSEVNPVISALQDHDFEITAVHNHLLNETPSIMYVHYWGRGSATTLAQALKEALGRSNTPIAAQTARPSPSARPTHLPGRSDSAGDRVARHGDERRARAAQPRPETIQMMGVTLPPSMGMATSINFQSAGAGKVAATGDFVMVADEVNKVARALRAHDIAITALHNHMVHGTPELYFMHFWGEGDATTVASGSRRRSPN